MSASAIPPEIIEAILHFLPAKSLGRFKSVSKTWNSLISHPQFIKKHLQRLQTTKLILFSGTSSVYSLDTNQLLPYLLNINKNSRNNDDDYDDIPATVEELSFRFTEVLGSCNGLVLAEDRDGSFFLINLTTQERYEVPLNPFVPPGGGRAIRNCGFGYDSSTDDYKIVTLSIWYRADDIVVASDPIDTYLTVYSLRNNSWKKLQPEFRELFVDLPILDNESFNWLQNFSNLVSFSFTSEGFNDFRMQLYNGQFVRIYNMVDSGGKLGAFYSKWHVYEVCVMEDNGNIVGDSSWTTVCFHMFEDYVNPVCLVEGSNRDIILDGKGGDVRVFNIDEKRWRNVKIEEGFGGFYVLGTYAESLESPKRFLRAP